MYDSVSGRHASTSVDGVHGTAWHGAPIWTFPITGRIGADAFASPPRGGNALTVTDQTREARLRRLAQRQGLLQKSGGMDLDETEQFLSAADS